MSKNKDQFIQAVANRIHTMADAETASAIVDIITYELREYSLERIGTEIVPYCDDNNKLIKTFLSCLIVEGRSKGTIDQYGRSLKKFFEFTGNKRYDSITAYDIRAWLAAFKLDGKKNTHIRNQRCNISPFFAWLYAEELIERNPCAAVKPIKVPDEEKKAFSSEEIDTIRDACKDSRERAVIEVLLSSGLRVAELCNLKKENIDLAELTINVKCGKGSKDRMTFINSVARKHIVAYLKDNKHDSEYLFTTRNGKNYTPGGIRYITDVLEERTGIHIHPHRFRRTLATDLAKRGMAIQEIQKLLGHTSIETTRKYIETRTEKVEASYRQYLA
jgi:site-specific recombinase XerD